MKKEMESGECDYTSPELNYTERKSPSWTCKDRTMANTCEEWQANSRATFTDGRRHTMREMYRCRKPWQGNTVTVRRNASCVRAAGMFG